MSSPVVPFGYFVWKRSSKGPPHFPMKFLETFMPVVKDSKWRLESEIIGDPIPILTKEEWELSLDALASKYPVQEASNAAR